MAHPLLHMPLHTNKWPGSSTLHVIFVFIYFDVVLSEVLFLYSRVVMMRCDTWCWFPLCFSFGYVYFDVVLSEVLFLHLLLLWCDVIRGVGFHFVSPLATCIFFSFFIHMWFLVFVFPSPWCHFYLLFVSPLLRTYMEFTK